MDIDCLKFLVKLYEYKQHRVYLAHWQKFKGKDRIFEQLGEKGLVNFTREIATVKITPAGQALLNLTTKLKIFLLLLTHRFIKFCQLLMNIIILGNI